MIDLGKYAVPILGAYASGISIMLLLSLQSILASRRAKLKLERLKQRIETIK